MRLFVSIIVLTMIIFMGCLFSGCVDTSSSSSKKIYLSPESLKSQAITLPYDELMRFNDKYAGKIIRVDGKVLQVHYGEEAYGGLAHTVPFIAVTEDDDNQHQILFTNYDYKKDGRVLEGDYITLYGILKGIKSMDTALGPRNVIEIDLQLIA